MNEILAMFSRFFFIEGNPSPSPNRSKSINKIEERAKDIEFNIMRE